MRDLLDDDDDANQHEVEVVLSWWARQKADPLSSEPKRKVASPGNFRQASLPEISAASQPKIFGRLPTDCPKFQ